MTNLSEQDREACTCPDCFDDIYHLVIDHPMWIGDDAEPLDYLPEREARIGDFLDELADIVRRARETAWDEGYDMGDPYQRRGNPNEGKHRNPYRAPGGAQAATEGTSSSLAGHGDVDDGVRGGGA